MAEDLQHLHDPEKAAEFARALGLMVGGHHPLLAIGRSKVSMRTVLENTRAKHISAQGAAKAIVSKTHTTPANLGNPIKNTALGTAMIPKFQKRFDKSWSD